MLHGLNINLNNFGLINNADIDVGKINVVGGLNSTGKSTCSKILYSFLRANAKSRKTLAKTTLVKEVFQLGFELLSFLRTAWDDDIDNSEYRDKIKDIVDDMRSKMDENARPDDFSIIDIFNQLKRIYANCEIKEDYSKVLDNSFSSVQKLVDIYDEDGDELFKTLMNQIIKREFGKNINQLKDVELTGKFNNHSFKYSVNLYDGEFNIDGWFTLEDVFYFDSFSVFDIISRGGLQNTEHISHVVQSLDVDESDDWGDEILNDNIIAIENKIMEITGGSFVKDDKNIIFIASDEEFLMKNTSSGIKQLGIIQMLLNTRQLDENSFLIMDEPEVNLHPEWQVRLAEILALLAKDLNVTIYINSHSPLFIEAINTYSKKFDLIDDTNFYLSYESEVEGKFDIEKIPSDELNIIYNSLGKPYELLSEINIEQEFGL